MKITEHHDERDRDRPRETVGDPGAHDRDLAGEDAERREAEQGEQAEPERGADEGPLVQQAAHAVDAGGAGGEEHLAGGC